MGAQTLGKLLQDWQRSIPGGFIWKLVEKMPSVYNAGIKEFIV